MSLSKESEVWRPSDDETLELTEGELDILAEFLEAAKEKEEEEPTVKEISRTEFFKHLSESEDGWINRALNIQQKMSVSQGKLNEAQTKLELIRIARYRVLRSEDMGLMVRFFDEGDRIFFEAELKRPAGFQT